MIEFQNVSKLYGDKEALSNLNLQIKNGEIMGLIAIMVLENRPP